MVSSRTAQGSVRGTIAIAMVLATRCAVVCGTMPIPTLHSTRRQTASKLRNCRRSRNGLPIRTALLARNRCNALARSSPTKVVVEHVLETDLRLFRQRVVARDHQHETVVAKRIGLQRARIDGSGDDAEIGNALGDQTDDLVAQPLLQIDADTRMRGQKRRQRFRQKFRQRVGVGQDADLTGKPAAIGAEILMQSLGLTQDRARMLQQGPSGWRRGDALPSAREQRHAQRLFHIADAGRCRGQRKVRAHGAVRDAAGLDHVAK